MSDAYYCVTEESVSEQIINKSRFITTLVPVRDAEEAFSQIKRISKKYSDATHNCYAFVSNIAATEQRFSDDGEPQGTAGIPMLEVLKKRNFRMVLAVVTRYFGGIKLGAGGLVSAYSSSVALAIDNAKTALYKESEFYSLRCDYAFFKKAEQTVSSCAQITNVEYGDGVEMQFAVCTENKDGLIEKLTDLSQGKAVITNTGKGYFGFDK